MATDANTPQLLPVVTQIPLAEQTITGDHFPSAECSITDAIGEAHFDKVGGLGESLIVPFVQENAITKGSDTASESVLFHNPPKVDQLGPEETNTRSDFQVSDQAQKENPDKQPLENEEIQGKKDELKGMSHAELIRAESEEEASRREVFSGEVKVVPIQQASDEEHEEESNNKSTPDEEKKVPGKDSSSSLKGRDFEAPEEAPSLAEEEKEDRHLRSPDEVVSSMTMEMEPETTDHSHERAAQSVVTQGESKERGKKVEPEEQSALTVVEGAEETSPVKEGTQYDDVEEEILFNGLRDKSSSLEATSQIPSRKEMIKEEATEGVKEEYDGSPTLAEKETTSLGPSEVVHEEANNFLFEGECKTMNESMVKVEEEVPNMKEAGFQDVVPTQADDVINRQDGQEEEGLEGGDGLKETYITSTEVESKKTLNPQIDIQSSEKEEDDMDLASQAGQICQGKSDQECVPLLSSEVDGEVISKGISERKDYENNCCLETSGERKAIEKPEPPQQDPQISMLEISQENKAGVSEPVSLAEGPSFVLGNDVTGEIETAKTNEHIQAAELRKEKVESLPDTEESRQEILPSEIKVYPSQQASIEEHEEESKSSADEELKAQEESLSSHSVQDFETHKEVLTLAEYKKEDTQGESEERSKEVEPVGQSAPTIQEGAEEMSSLKEGTKYNEVEEEMGAGEMSPLKEGTKYNEVEEEIPSNDVSDECSLPEETTQIAISKEIIKEAGVVEEYDGPSTVEDKQTTSIGQSVVVPEEDHSSEYECKTMIESTVKVEGEIPNMKEVGFQDAVPTQTDDVSDKQDVEEEEKKKKGLEEAGGDPREINFASSVVESEKTLDAKNEIQSSKKIEDDLAVACPAEQICQGKSDNESLPLLSPDVEGEVISKDISEREECDNCCVDSSGEGKAFERKHETPQQDSQISKLEIPQECKSDVPEPVSQAERHSSGLNNAVPETERTSELIQEAEFRKEEAETLPATEESRPEIFPSDIKVFPTQQASYKEHEEESKSTADEELKAPEESSSSHSVQDFETHKEVLTLAEDKKEDTQGESEERRKEVEPVGQSAPTIQEGTEEMSPVKEGTKSDEVEEEIPSNKVSDESSPLEATLQNPSSKEIIKEAVEGIEEEYDGSSPLAEEQTTIIGQSVVVAEEDHSFSFEDKCKTMTESAVKVEEEIRYVTEEGLQDAVLNQTDDILDKQDVQEEEKMKGLDEDGGDPRETYLASSEVKSEETLNAKNGTKKEEDDLAEQICQGKSDNESLPLLSPEVEGEIISKEISVREDHEKNCCVDFSGEEKATEKHETPQQDSGSESDAPEPGPQAEAPSFELNNDVTSETENARISKHIQEEELRKAEVGSVSDTNDSTSNEHEKTLKDNLQEDAEMAAQLEHAEVASFVKEEGTVKQFEETYEDHIQADKAAETETDNKDITVKAPVLAKDDLNVMDRSTETAFQDKSSNDLSASILSVDQTGENEVKQLEEAPVFVPDEKVQTKDDDSKTKMVHEEDTYVASRSSDFTTGEGEVDEEPEEVKVTATSRVAEAEAQVENEITDERKIEKIPEVFNPAENFENEKQMVENTDEKDTTPASDDEKQKNDDPETDTVLACKDEDKAQKGVHELETEAHTSGPAENQCAKGDMEAKIYTDEEKEESTTIEEEKQINKETVENVQPKFVPRSTTPSSEIVEQNRQIETSEQEENDHVKGLLLAATESKMIQDLTDDAEAKVHTEKKHEGLSLGSSLHQNDPENEGFDKMNKSSIEKHETSDNGKNNESLIFEEHQNNQESITDEASSVERHVASQDNTDENMHSLEDSKEKFKEDVLLETDAKDIISQDDACEEKKMQMEDSTEHFKDGQRSTGGKEAEKLLKEKIDNLSPQSIAVENEDMRSELAIPEYSEHMNDGHESITAEEYIQHGSINVEPSYINEENQESQKNITDNKEMKMEDVPEEPLQETIISQDEDTEKQMMEVDIKRETQEGQAVTPLPESSAENVVESFIGDEKEVTSSVIDEDETMKASEDVAGDIGEVGALPKYEEQNEIVHKQEAREQSQSQEISEEHKVVNETIQKHENSENLMEDKTDHKLLEMSASKKSEEPPFEEMNDSLTIDRKTIKNIPPEKHEDPAGQSTDDKLECLDQGLHSSTIIHEITAIGDDDSLAAKHNPVEPNIIKEVPTSAIGEDQESQDNENEIKEEAPLTKSAEQNTEAEKEEATKQSKEILQEDTENAIQSDESTEIFIDTEKQNVSEVPVSTKSQEPPDDKIIESFENVEDTTNEIHQERDEKLVVESTKNNMDHENEGLNTSTVSNERNASTDINSLTEEQHPIDENTIHTVSSSIITEDKEAKDVANDLGEAATLTKCEEQNTLVQEEEATLVQAEHTEGILELQHETENAIIQNDESMKKLTEEKKIEHETSQTSASEKSEESEVKEILECSKEKARETPKEKHKDPAAESTEDKINHEDQGSYSTTVIHEMNDTRNEESLAEKLQPVDLNIITGVSSSVIDEIKDQDVVNEIGEVAALPKSEEQATKQSRENFQEDMTENKTIQSDESIEILSKDIEKRNESKVCMSAKTEKPPIESFVDDENGTKEILQELVMESTKDNVEHETQGVSTSTVEYETHGSGDNHTLTTEQHPTDESTIEALSSSMIAEVKESKDVAGDDSEAAALTKCEEQNALVLTKATKQSEELLKEHTTVSETIQNDESIETLIEEDNYKLSGISVLNKSEEPPIKGDACEAAASTKCEEQNALVLTEATEQSEEILKEHKTVSETIQNDESIETLIEEDSYKLSGISVLNKSEDPPIKESTESSADDKMTIDKFSQEKHKDHEVKETEDKIEHEDQEKDSSNTIYDINATADDDSLEVKLHPVDVNITNEDSSPPVGVDTESQDVVNDIDETETVTKSEEQSTNVEKEETIKQTEEIPQKDQTENKTILIDESTEILIKDREEKNESEVTMSTKSEEPPVEEINESFADDENTTDKIPQEMYERLGVESTNDNVAHEKQGLNTSTVIVETNSSKHSESLTPKQHPTNENIVEVVPSSMTAEEKEIKDVACDDSEAATSTKGEEHQNDESFETSIEEDKEPPVKEIAKPYAEDRMTTEKTSHEMYKDHMEKGTQDNEDQGHKSSSIICNLNATGDGENLVENQHSVDVNIAKEISSSVMCEAKESQDVVNEIGETEVVTSSEVKNTKAQREATEQTDEILVDKTENKTILSHEIEDREEQESKLYESTRSEEPTVEKINEFFVDDEHSTKEISQEIHKKLAVESTKNNIEHEDRGMNTSTVTYETNASGYSPTLTPEQYPIDENIIEAVSSSVIVEDKEVTDVACDDREAAALTKCEGQNTLVQKEEAIEQSEEISKVHKTMNETIQNDESIKKLIEDNRGHMESENSALKRSEKPLIQEIIESYADDNTLTEKISQEKQKDLADEETEDKLVYEDQNNSSSIIHDIDAAVDGESLAEKQHSVNVNIAKEVSSPVISEDKKSQHDVYEIREREAMTKSEEENMKAQIEEATQQTEEILQEDRTEHKTIEGTDNVKNLMEEKEGHKECEVYVSTKSEESQNIETTESSVDDEKATTEIPQERHEKLAVESTKVNLEHENQTLKSATAEYNTTVTGDRQSLTAEVHPVNVNTIGAISSSFIAEDDRESEEVANESGESSEHKTVNKTIQIVESRDNLVEEISELSASSKSEESINAMKSKETPDASLPCLNVTCDDMEKDKEIDETLTKDAPEHDDKDNVDLHYQEEEYEQRTDEGTSEQIRTIHEEIHQDPQSGKEDTTKSCNEEANLKSDGTKDEIIENGGSPELQKQSDVKMQKHESRTIQNFDEQACEEGIIAGYHLAELTQNEASTENSRSGEAKYEEKQEILHKAPESGRCINDKIEATTSKTFSADVPSSVQEETSQLKKEDDLLTNKLIGMENEVSSPTTVETEKLHEGEESTESATDNVEMDPHVITNKEAESHITCDSNDNVEMDPHVITERRLFEAENLEKLHGEIKQQHKSDGTSESVSEKENEITNRGSDNSSIDIVEQSLKEASIADETAAQKGAIVTGINEQDDSVDNYDGSTNWAVEVEKTAAIQVENHSISSKEGASYTERDFPSAYEVSSEPENKEEYKNIQHVAGTSYDQNDPQQASNGEKEDVQEKTLKTFDSAFKEDDHARDSQQTTGTENSKPTEKPSKETQASKGNNMSEDGVPEANAENAKCGPEVCEAQEYTMEQKGKEIEPVTKQISSQKDQQNDGSRTSLDLSLETKADEAKYRVCNIRSEDEGMNTNLEISSSPTDLPSISDDANKSSERSENPSANKVEEITRVVIKHHGDADEGSKEIKEHLMVENQEEAILRSQAQTNKLGDEIISENESEAGNISSRNETEEKPMPSQLSDEKEHKTLIEIQKLEEMTMNRTGPTKDDNIDDSASEVTKYENYMEEKGPEETEVQVGKEPTTSNQDEIASANYPILSSLPSQERLKGDALEDKKQESTKKDEDDSDTSGIPSSLSTPQALVQAVSDTVTGDAIQEFQQGEEKSSSQKDSSESEDHLQAENQWASQDPRKMVEKSTEQSFVRQNPGEIDPSERLADAAEGNALMPLPQEQSAKSRNRAELEEWEMITKKEAEYQGQEEKDDAIKVTEVLPMQTVSTNTPMYELQQRSEEGKLQVPAPSQEADLSIEVSHKETASELHDITLTRYEEAIVYSNQGSTGEGRWISQDTGLKTQELHEVSEKPELKEMNDKIINEERSDSPHQTEMSVMNKQPARFEAPLSLSEEGKDHLMGKDSHIIEEAPEVTQSEIISKTINFPEKGNEVESLKKEMDTQNQRLIRESAYEDSIITEAGIQRNQEDTTLPFLQERKEILNQTTRKEQGADIQQKQLSKDKEIPQEKTRIMDDIFSQEPQQCDEHDQIKPHAKNGIDMLDSGEIKESKLLSKETTEESMQPDEVEDSSQEIQKGSFQEKQDKERSKEQPKSMPVAAAVDPLLGTEQIPTTETSRMIGKPIEEDISTEYKERMKGSEMKEIDSPKTDEEKEEEGDEPSIDDPIAPMIIKASKNVEVRTPHKKSHNILSGVGSKVKHSISKVKKAITGKSSHPKSTSPK